MKRRIGKFGWYARILVIALALGVLVFVQDSVAQDPCEGDGYNPTPVAGGGDIRSHRGHIYD